MATKYFQGVATDEWDRDRRCCYTPHRSWQGALACVQIIACSWETLSAMEVTREGRTVLKNGYPIYHTGKS